MRLSPAVWGRDGDSVGLLSAATHSSSCAGQPTLLFCVSDADIVKSTATTFLLIWRPEVPQANVANVLPFNVSCGLCHALHCYMESYVWLLGRGQMSVNHQMTFNLILGM